MSDTASAIEFVDAGYAVDGRWLLKDAALSIQTGKLAVLLGRSGAGKTTALRLINRLIDPTAGEVRVDGVATTKWDPIQLRRRIGYAIQEVGLFPHFTVAENVGIVPRLAGWEKARIEQRVAELLDLLALPSSEFAQRYPRQLSGGQRQRVGLARALAADPPILLLDEPFGALDRLGRAQLQRDFKALQQKLGKTAVFVTHDVQEALALADQVVLVDSGRLQGSFTPQSFRDSQDPLIREFVSGSS